MDSFTEELLIGSIIPIYKPLEWTSFDTVNKLKWKLKKHNKKIKIGHAGTLDPLAEGLLIICTGKMTKQVETIQAQPKTYIAEIMLGATRPSYDRETEIDNEYPTKHITESMVVNVINTFQGKQTQIPPSYSAIKKDGKPVYLQARKGNLIVLQPREYEVFEIKVLEISLPKITVEMKVSKGTYVRTMAHDIGQKLNSGAYLHHLIRSKIGDYTIENAWKLDELVSKIELPKE